MNGKQRRAKKRNLANKLVVIGELVKGEMVKQGLLTPEQAKKATVKGPAAPRKKHRAPHTSAPRGKRILVVLKDGEQFVDKFIERRPNHVVFEGRTVAAGEIQKFSIYKHIEKSAESLVDKLIHN